MLRARTPGRSALRALYAAALALGFAACAPAASTGDGGEDAAAGDGASVDDVATSEAGSMEAAVVDAGPVLPRCEDTESMGTAPMMEPVQSTLQATIVPMAMRLAMAGENPALEEGETAARALGLDRYALGPGEDRVRRAELAMSSTPATGARKSLAWFVHFSDTQLVDDESPARLSLLDNPSSSGGLRPQEAYIPHAMSAMNRTLRDLARPERPFQFGFIAGDCADSAQLNELEWFMQLMNGVPGVHVDSGDDNDPLPGPNNDPKDPFDPVAFPAPWYFVPGNHDVLVVGISVLNETQRAQALGSNAPNGTRDYTRRWAPARRGRVVPDAKRRLLSREEIVALLRTGPAMPGPVGHGYAAMPNLATGAHYAVDVVPGLLRMLALDTSDTTGGSQGMVRQSTVDMWLRPELERAQRDGVLVVLSSHHGTNMMDRRSAEVGPEVPDALEPAAVERLVASYANVIGWFVGHNHRIQVRAIRGADAMHPGYWQIESGSLADFPNTARAVELVDNGDGTLSILGTMVNFSATNCFERRFRRLSMMDMLAGWESDLRGVREDRNVELVLPIPAGAATAVRTAAMTAPSRLESETTLRGMR